VLFIPFKSGAFSIDLRQYIEYDSVINVKLIRKYMHTI
jgi:hypothetical protein